MKSISRLIMLLTLSISIHAQIDTELIAPDQDQRDLFARAAASRIAIIGTVVNSEGISERIAPEALQERLNKGTVRGGSLMTVHVEEIVCRQSDFNSEVTQVSDYPQPFYLFIPFDELNLPDGQYREALLPKKRYLLLLTDLDSNIVSATYNLEPNRIYYRGLEHNRGVIPLEPQSPTGKAQKPPEVVDQFRKLCTAMRPPKLKDKMALLQQLTDSGDPVLQKEAEEGKKAVRKQIQNAADHQENKESHMEPK